MFFNKYFSNSKFANGEDLFNRTSYASLLYLHF